MKIEILAEENGNKFEFTIETENVSLVTEASESKHCVDKFEDFASLEGNLELVQLYFNTVAEFKDWFNTAF
jgi:hypothetical protein